jgi:putrescine---pyruvate transaminase
LLVACNVSECEDAVPRMSPQVEPKSPHLWHPFSRMPRDGRAEVILDRGAGVRVWDVDGNEYLDALAGLWFCNVGHGRQELADVAAAQMSRLASFHTFGSIANQPALDLAERLCEIVSMPEPCAVFLVSGGSDAVDTAGKMVRRYWQVRGEPRRTTIISRSSAYHGMHAYGTSLAGIEENASGWGTMVRDTVRVPADDLAALADLLDRDDGQIAAFIGEPVIGAGGVYPPADGYWPAVRDLCDEHGILLIADEVITGYGRLGSWFGSEKYGITPDLLTSAKGLTSGYAPLGAVFAGPAILDVLWGDDAPMFRHGYTYSGHAAACAVAIANLEIIECEDLLARAGKVGDTLATLVHPLVDHPLVTEVRTAGAMAAIQLLDDVVAARVGLVDEIVAEARTQGVLTRGLAGRALQVSPALIATEEELTAMVDGLRGALDATAERTPLLGGLGAA